MIAKQILLLMTYCSKNSSGIQYVGAFTKCSVRACSGACVRVCIGLEQTEPSKMLTWNVREKQCFVVQHMNI